ADLRDEHHFAGLRRRDEEARHRAAVRRTGTAAARGRRRLERLGRGRRLRAATAAGAARTESRDHLRREPRRERLRQGRVHPARARRRIENRERAHRPPESRAATQARHVRQRAHLRLPDGEAHHGAAERGRRPRAEAVRVGREVGRHVRAARGAHRRTPRRGDRDRLRRRARRAHRRRRRVPPRFGGAIARAPMIRRLIALSARNRLIVLVQYAIILILGVWATLRTPLDAIPDISDNQVIVYVDWPGRAPQLVEDQVTYPLATNLQGMPNLKAVRAQSMFGFSLIYVIFDDDVDIYWARTRVLERLNYVSALLPAGVTPRLGPEG